MVPLIRVGEKSYSSIASATVGTAVEERRVQVSTVLSVDLDEAEIVLV